MIDEIDTIKGLVKEFFYRHDSGTRDEILSWLMKNKVQDYKRILLESFKRYRKKINAPLTENTLKAYSNWHFREDAIKNRFSDTLSYLSMKKFILHDSNTKRYYFTDNSLERVIEIDNMIKKLKIERKELFQKRLIELMKRPQKN